MKRILWLILPLFIACNVFSQAPIPTSKYVKAKMFINVRDYGATGDSSQDALPYLKAARDALASRLSTGENGILYFPYGTYRLADSAFSIETSGIHMVGDGARIITTDSLYSGHLIGIVGDSDNIIRDASIRGFEIHDYYRDTTKNNGIGVVWADGPVISDNVIRFATRKGISTHYVRNAWIERNKIDTACFSGISIEWGTEDSGGLYQNIWVKDNIIELVDTSLVQNNASGDQYVWVGKGNGIVVTSHDTSAAIMEGRTLENVFVMNNVIGTVPKKPIAWVNYTSQRKPVGLEVGNIVLDSLRYGKFAGAFDVARTGQIRLYQTDTTQAAAATRGFVTTRDGDYTKADLLGLHLFSSGTSDLNVIEVGGGFSSYQAADYGRLFSADGHGDTEGSQRARWDSTQFRIFGVPLRLDSSLYMDYNNNQEQQYIYFSDEGGVGQAWLRFDTTSDVFTFSNGLVVNSNSLYIGGSANQQYNYLYFPDEAGSGQAWLRFDTTNEAFMLSTGTNLYKAGTGGALVADSQYVTKDYADNASAGLADGSVTWPKLAAATVDSFLQNTDFQDSLEAAVLNADSVGGVSHVFTGLTNREVVLYSNAAGIFGADSINPSDLHPEGATTGQLMYWNGSIWDAITMNVSDSSSLLDNFLKNVSDTMMWIDGTDTLRGYFNGSSEFIWDGPGSGPSFADSAGAVDTANVTFTTYVTNHAGGASAASVGDTANDLRGEIGDTADVVRAEITDTIEAITGDVTVSSGVSSVTAQSIVGDDVDSTAENFTFSGAYHITSAEADSAYVTANTINDTANVLRAEIGDSLGRFDDTAAVHDSLDVLRGEVGDSINSERIFDLIAPFFASNVEDGISVVTQDPDNTIDFTTDTTGTQVAAMRSGIYTNIGAARDSALSDIRDTVGVISDIDSANISNGGVAWDDLSTQAKDSARAGSGGGSEDSLYINDGSTEYDIIGNKIVLKEGAGIDLAREDSTTYDVIRLNATLGATVSSSEITNQTIVGDDIDSTAENFVFDDPYKGTSAEADSVLTTRAELGDTAAAVRADITDSVASAANLNPDIFGDITVWGNINHVNWDFTPNMAYARTVHASEPMRLPYLLNYDTDPCDTNPSLCSAFFEIDYSTIVSIDTVRGQDTVGTDRWVTFYDTIWQPDSTAALHPDIIYVPQGIEGYRYFLCHTPLAAPGTGASPPKNDDHENVYLLASRDGEYFDWPSVDTNLNGTFEQYRAPIMTLSEFDSALFLADPDIYFYDGKLFVNIGVSWDGGGTADAGRIYAKYTTDLINYSDTILVARFGPGQSASDGVSPSFVVDTSGTVRMYAIEFDMWDGGANDTNGVLIWETDDPTAQNNFSLVDTSYLRAIPKHRDTAEVWHLNAVSYGPERILFIVTDVKYGTGGTRTWLHLVASNDGGKRNFTYMDDVLLLPVSAVTDSGENDCMGCFSIYRSSAYWRSDGGQTYLELLYSGDDGWADSPPAPGGEFWATFRTRVRFDRPPRKIVEPADFVGTYEEATDISSTFDMTFPNVYSDEADSTYFQLTHITADGGGFADDIFAAIWLAVPEQVDRVDTVQIEWLRETGFTIDSLVWRGPKTGGFKCDSTYKAITTGWTATAGAYVQTSIPVWMTVRERIKLAMFVYGTASSTNELRVMQARNIYRSTEDEI